MHFIWKTALLTLVLLLPSTIPAHGDGTAADQDKGETAHNASWFPEPCDPNDLHVAHGDIFHVHNELQNPKKLSTAPPHYTEEARTQKIQGVVILQVVIDELGDVVAMRVLKGLPGGLTESAMAAVKQWKFEPAMLDDEPVKVFYNLTVNFRLDNK